MDAGVWNRKINFVLGANGENAVNQNGRKWIEFAIENE
jgi:hypothetical protein